MDSFVSSKYTIVQENFSKVFYALKILSSQVGLPTTRFRYTEQLSGSLGLPGYTKSFTDELYQEKVVRSLRYSFGSRSKREEGNAFRFSVITVKMKTSPNYSTKLKLNKMDN